MGFLLLRASEEGPVMHYMHSNSFQCLAWCNITHYLHMLQIIKQSSTTSDMSYKILYNSSIPLDTYQEIWIFIKGNRTLYHNKSLCSV